MVKFQHNREFFKTPNLLNSYWAGFIAADGNIQSSKNVLAIQISEKDRNHLERFAADVEFTGIVKSRKQISFGKENSVCYMYLCSAAEIVSDLKRNFLICPAKSKTLEFPILSEELTAAYIVGYIDGDGSVTYKTSTKPYGTYVYPVMSVIGTRSTLSGIKDYFDKHYNTNIKSSIRPCGKMFVYDISGKQVTKIIEHVRLLEVPRLERKWNKVT